MEPQIVLGIGSGQCGFQLLVEILQGQPGTHVAFEEPPVLPWRRRSTLPGIRERIARWKRGWNTPIIGDVASFYLPYVEDAIQCEPTVRIVCMKRSREEVIEGFSRYVDAHYKVPINHWSEIPLDGWYHDPVLTQTFPQYSTQDREEAIGLYWDD